MSDNSVAKSFFNIGTILIVLAYSNAMLSIIFQNAYGLGILTGLMLALLGGILLLYPAISNYRRKVSVVLAAVGIVLPILLTIYAASTFTIGGAHALGTGTSLQSIFSK